MDDFYRDTSPDPLTLAISPPVSHARASKSPTRSRSRSRSPSKPLATRSSNVFVTPSKTIVMDTGKRDNLSPWRIKVTVEAEPREASPTPARRTRTTTIPLRGSSSPAKKQVRRTPGPERDHQVKVPARKRKGTPIKRTPKVQPPPVMNAEPTTDEDDAMSDRTHAQQSPTRSSGARKKRQSLPKMSTGRYGRLSQAREELDEALQAALGDRQASQSPGDLPLTSDAFDSEVRDGDMTVSTNEDFTMVSVESLESYRKHALNNASVHEKMDHEKPAIIQEEDECLAASTLPSSPPQEPIITYPDMTTRDEHALHKEPEQQSSVRIYDAMSWKPTGPLENFDSVQRSPAKDTSNKVLDEPTEWRLEREAVSREIQNASASQVIVIEDSTRGAISDEDEDDDDADIWQEEASRSLEEDDGSAIAHQEGPRSPALDDFFADQPIKPLRSKIPRTWRRTSGADFSYSDSPDHKIHQDADRCSKPTSRRTSAGGTGDDEGILTPPTTDDEVAKKTNEAEDVDSSDLTEPDAAATQLQADPVRVAPTQQWKADFSPLLHHRRISETKEHVPSPLASAGSSSEEVTSPEGEDTGYFWQRNMPHVYNRRPQRPRPKRKSAMDLSELLNLKSSPQKAEDQPKSTTAATASNSTHVEAASSAYSGQAYVGRVTEDTQPAMNKLINTPLRKSLLKSSKLASPLVQTTTSSAASSFMEGSSLESKTSDQRQLLNEVNATPQQLSSSPSTFYDTEEPSEVEPHGFSVPDEESSLREDESYEHDPFRSYEENLNLESPTKIKVKFNDSTVESSALAPSKQYPSLFGSVNASNRLAKPEQHSPGTLTLVAKRETQDPGMFSRLSSTFWQAVIRPTGPTEIIPPPAEPEPEFPLRLRAQIRRRYGVVPNVHPWTMVHMRTLHRMENSRASGKYDSIIPKKGPLPSFLRPLVNKRQKSVSDYDFTLCIERAHVVFAMLQTLVDPELVRSMESGDIDFLGDSAARDYRKTDPLGRRGKDSPYAGDEVIQPAPGRPIDGWFIMRALGDCVAANELGPIED